MLVEFKPAQTISDGAPKEMLSVEHFGNKAHVRINFSSLDLIATCKRKAYFRLERKLASNVESPALTFGSAIHKALEVWYCAPRDSRKASSAECDDSQALMVAGAAPLAHGQCVRCAAVFTFVDRGHALRNLPQGDKRSLDNGVATLNAYFDHYGNDAFTLLSDAEGPICERRFEFIMTDSPRVRITFFGTIDAILFNEETKSVVVCDHKTTHALGNDFYNRVRPNFQYTGYVWAAQKMGLKSDMFLSNGIQVAKTKKEFARQITRVTEEDFTELRYAVEYAVEDYLSMRTKGVWPMNAPNACTLYGACEFRSICEVPNALKENVIIANYANSGPQAEGIK